MSQFNTKSMFEAIKQSLSTEKESGGNGLYREILKFKAGSTYQVRLLANPNAPKETIFHYYNHGWNSLSTGKFVTALCPTTFGDTCPIDKYYLNTYRNGTESEKKAAAVLSRKEGWMVNVYVISDPDNPANDGTVKILRYGKELDKIIQNALTGDDAEDFGVEKVFDLLSGSTLRIKCENKAADKRGGKNYTTYTSSRFLTPSTLDLDDQTIEKIYSSVHDLKSVNKQTTFAEMQRLLDEHFFCLSTGSAQEPADDEDDEPPFETGSHHNISSKSESVAVASKPAVKHEPAPVDESDDTDESTDEKLKKLLAGLD